MQNGPPPRSTFRRSKCPRPPPVYNGPPRSTLRRGKWTPPLGKLGILQTLPPVPFHYAKWTPCPFSPVEYGPPGQLYAVVNGPPRKVRNIANGTPGPFSPVENGPPGPFSTVENGPGGPFSTGENGPGVHFQRLKMDLGGSIFNG